MRLGPTRAGVGELQPPARRGGEEGSGDCESPLRFVVGWWSLAFMLVPFVGCVVVLGLVNPVSPGAAMPFTSNTGEGRACDSGRVV